MINKEQRGPLPFHFVETKNAVLYFTGNGIHFYILFLLIYKFRMADHRLILQMQVPVQAGMAL